MARPRSQPLALCFLALPLWACGVPNPAYEGRIQTVDVDAALYDTLRDDATTLAPDTTFPRPDAATSSPDAAATLPDARLTTPDAPAGGLQARFALDDGGNTVSDSSGHGLVGTLVNMDPATCWVTGRKGGKALDFNPTAATPHPGVRIDATGMLAGLQHMTVAAWVYRTDTSTPDQMTVVSQALDASMYEVFNLSFYGGRLNFFLPGNTGITPYNTRASDVTPVGVWTHTAATFDGTTSCLYRDGTLIKSITYAAPLPVSNEPIYIGTNINPSNEQPFVGYIDDVVIYNEALSATEIAALAAP